MILKASTTLIAGAYGYGNTGDDAILKLLLSELRMRVPGLQPVVLSDSPDETAARYGVAAIHWQDIPSVVEAARSCDVMLLGGGGLFYDYWGANPDSLLTERHSETAYFAGIALLARLLNKPFMPVAVGVGPLMTEEGRLLTRATFEQATLASVRDPESKQVLDHIGVDTSRVYVTADPAFLIRPAAAEHARSIIESDAGASPARPLVCAALRQWDFRTSPDVWEREVAAGLDQFLAEHGGTVLFIPFHRAVKGGLADDPGLAARIIERMQRRHQAVMLREGYSPEELAGVVGQCDLALGMRLHAVIFALRAGVPVVTLTYDPKVSNALARFSLSGWGIDPREVTADSLARMLGQAYRDGHGLKAAVTGRARELESLSEENVRLAAGLLKGDANALPPSESAEQLLARPAVKDTLKRLGLISARRGVTSGGMRGEQSVTHARTPGDFGRFIRSAREAATAPEPHPVINARNGWRPRVAYLAYMLLDWKTQQPRFGGGERYALTLGTLLRDLGFDVTFFQAATSRFEGEYYGFPVTSIPFAESYSEFQYGLSDEFYRLTKGYDHIVYNLAEFATGAMREDALLICHGVWFDHNNYPPPTAYRTGEWFRHLYRAFSRPRKVVSVDTNSINVIRALWPALAERMAYVPNWVDVQMFAPPAGRNSGRPTVLFPRRSQINRGTRMIRPILERVEADCDFVWVGEGEAEETELIKAVAESDPRLRFVAVPFEGMPLFYKQADICVIPSVGSEGTSLSCLEAMASGCAVIATNVGGLPNLIQHEVSGLLVDPEPDAVASAINRLLADPEERAAYQRAAVEIARHFDISRWRRRWIDLLRELRWID